MSTKSGRRLHESGRNEKSNGFQNTSGVNTYLISRASSETNGVKVSLTSEAGKQLTKNQRAI